jgi:thiol-disulfide isomerase/thioredoxin
MPQSTSSLTRLAVIVLIGGGLLLAVLAWRSQQEQDRAGRHHAVVGKVYLPKELPPLTAKDAIHADDLKGKVVLINFWGWWCGPCQVEFPHLMELKKSLRDNPDFRFISVASSGDPNSDESDSELRDKTHAFLTEHQADIPTYIDPRAAEQGRIAALAGKELFGLPLTIIIGRDGTIRGLWPGYTSGDELSMRAVVDEALK